MDTHISGMLLACGTWMREADYNDYDTHQQDCVLCKDITFIMASDIVYDVILPCGEAFMRSLTRLQWADHQMKCAKCKHARFPDPTDPVIVVDLKYLANIAQCPAARDHEYLTMDHCNTRHYWPEKLLNECSFRIWPTGGHNILVSWINQYLFSTHTCEECSIIVPIDLWRCFWRMLQLKQEHELKNIVQNSFSTMPSAISHTINYYTCISYSQMFQAIPIILDTCATKHQCITNSKRHSLYSLDARIVGRSSDAVLVLVKSMMTY